MDKQVKIIIEATKKRLSLSNYYLKRKSLYSEPTHLNETIYLLNMEWFPNIIDLEQLDEDLNPPGTVSVDVNVQTLEIRSIIFVEDISYAQEPSYPTQDKQTVINWIEDITKLKYKEEFQLVHSDDHSFSFSAVINDIVISPAAGIEIEFNKDGKLSFFSIYGDFPKENKSQESFLLTKCDVAKITNKQIGLIRFPQESEEKWVSFYGLEEVFITNDQSKTFPFDAIERSSLVLINKVLKWDKALEEDYTYKDIDLSHEVTNEQARKKEAHPDTFPITRQEKQSCIAETTRFLQGEYQSDSGKWILTRLFRDNRYIIAELEPINQSPSIIVPKLKVIIDRITFKVINYIDTHVLYDLFSAYKEPDEATISHEEAFQRLHKHIKLTPTYIYDHDYKSYVLCGKLDCDYGVNAVTGEVVLLDKI